MEKRRHCLHIVMLPYLAFSHVKPFFELSKSISQLGHLVSFISTPPNIQTLNSTQSSLPSSTRLIALPDSDLNSIQNEESFEKILRSATPPIDWVLLDYYPFWAPQVTRNLGIQCALIELTSAVSNCFIWPAVNETNKPKLEDLIVPPKRMPFDTSVAYKPFEARQVLDNIFEPNQRGFSMGQSMCLAIQGCDVVAIRSCSELEPEWLGLLPQLYNKLIFPLGLLPCDGSTRSEDQHIFKWLDRNETGSVLYVAFGSEILLSQEQVHELAHGLEISNLPFVWALRILKGEESIELPDGFEDRTRHRGIVCNWVPQVKILAHPSVGGFLTHCGWNSVTEAICHGVPLVLFPFANDQALNARFLAKQKIGVEIPRNENDGSFLCNDVARILRLVMVGQDGKSVRDRAKELKSIFGGREFHENYVEKFVMYLQDKKKH